MGHSKWGFAAHARCFVQNSKLRLAFFFQTSAFGHSKFQTAAICKWQMNHNRTIHKSWWCYRSSCLGQISSTPLQHLVSISAGCHWLRDLLTGSTPKSHVPVSCLTATNWLPRSAKCCWTADNKAVLWLLKYLNPNVLSLLHRPSKG
jgi:hypothetical protein